MINIGIVGFGNVGKSVVSRVKEFKNLSLVAVFTRRNPDKFDCPYPIYHVTKLNQFKGKIDVLLLCTGSYADVSSTASVCLKDFCTIDCYDNHNNFEDYANNLDKIARKHQTLCLIGAGWDPGLFSIQRVLLSAVMPNEKIYTVWGKGVSQGHTNVLKTLNGVRHAIQFTIPSKNVKKIAKNKPNVSSSDLHKRKCVLCVEKGVDKKGLVKTIKNIPNYFKGYKTSVKFLSEKKFFKRYKTFKHGGSVFSVGSEKVDFSLSLKSNPDFTASIMLAYVQAVYKLFNNGFRGVMSVLDVPISALVENKNTFL